jgi:hypothetical protein
VSVHPGLVDTDLLNTLSMARKLFVLGAAKLMGVSAIPQEKGRLNQLWAAAGAKKSDLVNGAFYMPVGVQSNDKLDKTAKSAEFATELWTWTQDVLAKFGEGPGKP